MSNKVSNKKTHKIIRNILITVVAILLVMVIAMAIYLGNYYHAKDVDQYMTSGDYVTVTEDDDAIYFDGPGTDTAIIFYPGAKVEAKSYAPVMYKLAENGTDCFILKVPFNIAMLAQNAPLDIMSTYDYENWYIGGHSLGGYVATEFVYNNPSDVKGIILLASFATSDLSDLDIDVISIYGDKDGVLSMESVEKGRELMPKSYTEVVIEGANHCQMGSYGFQKGDNQTDMSNEKQIDTIVNIIDGALEK